jgi:dGTPase
MEHVLHVASASRIVARHLKLNEDLTEAVGLAHDLGHAPFGHHGEAVLKRLSECSGTGISFEHEIHGLRVVDKLAELDREDQPGLNLTFEVRDGIISHCGEDFSPESIPHSGEKDLTAIRSRRDAGHPCTLEGCIVRVVDKIAYAGRDVEDALVAELIDETCIPRDIAGELGKNNGEIVGRLLEDVIRYSENAVDRIGMSKEKHEALQALIKFNYEEIYHQKAVERFKKQATYALEELYARLHKDLDTSDRLKDLVDLPDVSVYKTLGKFIRKVGYDEGDPNSLIVLDFISGMTDNYVIQCLDELFVPKYTI